MDAQAILTVGAAVVALVGLLKWMGVNQDLHPLAVPITLLVCSIIGVAFWAWSQADITRESAFDYFSGFVLVMTSAAGVFGYTRTTAESISQIRTGTGDGGIDPRRFTGSVLLAVVLGGLTLAGCGSKVAQVENLPANLPAAVDAADQDVKAFAIHALQIIELSGEVADDASDIYLQIKASGLVPVAAQASIDAGFRAFSRQAREGIEEIRKGSINTWAALKAQVDPIVSRLQVVIDAVRGAGPSVWQRVGRGLQTALQLLLSAVAVQPYALGPAQEVYQS